MTNPSDIHLLDVTAEDIVDWASKTAGAEYKFPRIIEELVHASSKDVSFHHFHSGKENNWPGFDGVVRHVGVHDYIPQGESIWEIGINKDVAEKINDDYQKRVEECSEEERAELTFVFVSPRKWRGKAAWVGKKRKLKEWKDVRVYDATDLQTWFNENPTCKLHFIKMMGRQIVGAGTLEEEWHYWANATIFTLPHYLFQRDIRESLEHFLQWVRRPAEHCFVVRADSVPEGLAFLRCLLESPELKHEKSLAVVIKHRDALSPLIAQNIDFIPIVCDEKLLDMCVHPEKNLHTIVVRTKEVNVAVESPEIGAELQLVDFDSIQRFQKEIQSVAGVRKLQSLDVQQIAREMGYCRVLIRSRMLKNGTQPAWLKRAEYRDVIMVLAMLGVLTSSDDFSRKIHMDAQMLSEASWRQYRELLFGLAGTEESPIWMLDLKHSPYINGFMCGVHSLQVALYQIRDRFDKQVIDRLFVIYRSLFFSEKGHSHQYVKQHIMRALLVFQVHEFDWDIEEGAYLCEKTAQFHRDLLAYICAHPASENAAYLRLLAEMRPDDYLTWWENHPEHAAALSGERAYGTSLAVLAVPGTYFMRVFRLIINAVENAGTEASELRRNLCSCFLFNLPQTNASVYERKRAYRVLLTRAPYMAIETVKNQIQTMHHSHCIFPTPTALMRKGEWQHRESITYGELWEFANFSVEAAIDAIEKNPDAVDALIDSINLLWQQHTEHAWRVLRKIFDRSTLSEQLNICDKLFEQLRMGMRRKEAPTWLPTMCQSFSELIHTHPVLEIAPYFSRGFSSLLWERVPFERAAQVHLRLAALKLHQCLKKGVNPIPYLLASVQTNWSVLGECISCRFSEAFVLSCFLEYPEEKYPAEAVKRFRCGLMQMLNSETLRSLLTKLLEQATPEEQLTYALLAPKCQVTWDIVQTDASLEKKYWKHVKSIPFFQYEEVIRDKVVNNLLAAGNYSALLMELDYVRESCTGVVLRVLRAIARELQQELWENGTISEHTVVQIMQQLDENACRPGELAKLEFRFAPILCGNMYDFPHISRLLSTHAHLVARFYTWFDRFRMVKNPHPASIRYFLIESIRMPLYCSAANVSLPVWCREVLAADMEDIESVQSFVGSCLVTGSLQTMKNWLTPEITQCVERFHTPSFDRGFTLALENSIGVTTRSFDAGGAVERRFISYIQEVIDEFELADKHLGHLLREVQKTQVYHGKMQDIQAITQRHMW